MHPLDGSRFVSGHSHASHEHFLKVVRTSFRLLSGSLVGTYHLSSSSSQHEAHEQPPAVSFTYDLSPMQVVITEEAEGLFRFVVFIFAIIGGGFTVFGLIDSLFFHTERVLREKVGLGKAA